MAKSIYNNLNSKAKLWQPIHTVELRELMAKSCLLTFFFFTHIVDQAGLELRNPSASAFPSDGIKGMRHYTRPKVVF